MRNWWQVLPVLIASSLALFGCGQSDETQQDHSSDRSQAEPVERIDYADLSLGAVATGPGTPAPDATGRWTQFRGHDRSNIAHSNGAFQPSPDNPPAEIWRIENLAPGYAGPAVFDGKVYFHDYDRADRLWMVRCVSLADGREIWRWSYERPISLNHGITRTVPAVDADRVYSIDPKSTLHCLDAHTGKRLWAVDLPLAYNAVIPPWYNGQCPLIEDDRLIIGVGGPETLMLALDKTTGREIWRTPNASRHPMSHASIMPITVDGVRQYLWCTLRGLLGVSADGDLLWEHPHRFSTSVSPSPLPLPDGRVFMTSGYRAGSVMIQIRRDGDGDGDDNKFATEQLFARTEREIASDCHTPIFHRNHIFAVSSADKDGRLVCIDLDGEIRWQHPDLAFGLGSYILIDDTLLVLEGDTGILRFIAADPDAFREIASFQILSGHDVWAPMAYADGKLILRDMGKIICLDLASE